MACFALMKLILILRSLSQFCLVLEDQGLTKRKVLAAASPVPFCSSCLSADPQLFKSAMQSAKTFTESWNARGLRG